LHKESKDYSKEEYERIILCLLVTQHLGFEIRKPKYPTGKEDLNNMPGWAYISRGRDPNYTELISYYHNLPDFAYNVFFPNDNDRNTCPKAKKIKGGEGDGLDPSTAWEVDSDSQSVTMAASKSPTVIELLLSHGSSVDNANHAVLSYGGESDYEDDEDDDSHDHVEEESKTKTGRLKDYGTGMNQTEDDSTKTQKPFRIKKHN
jgi:hypothetical protein